MGSSCTPTIVDNITRRITDNMTTTACEGHHQRVTENNTHNQTDNQNLSCQSYYFIDDLVLEHQCRQWRFPHNSPPPSPLGPMNTQMKHNIYTEQWKHFTTKLRLHSCQLDPTNISENFKKLLLLSKIHLRPLKYYTTSLPDYLLNNYGPSLNLSICFSEATLREENGNDGAHGL